MRHLTSPQQQSGITLFVGMIMLVLITLMVTSAFMLSNTNLKVVGNMQAKEESIAAANQAIEQILTSPFTNQPKAEVINVDINSDGNRDYVVNIAIPTCIKAALETKGVETSTQIGRAAASQADIRTKANLDPGATIGGGKDWSTATMWNTVWEIEATVNNLTTGAKTVVSSGVRVLLSETQKNLVCT